ncbi:RTC domain-containing 1 [Coprinopsis sp. MPI-PUGE-AT-0042]|nr:RTC domain-containing 1 [Coprinopsis sp. MPI-PUGE-AT-0042]
MSGNQSEVDALLDGSILEGGGQILRNAVAFASLLNKSITIEKIRGGRKPPGLKNQHRVGLELASRIASAELSNAKNGSRSITFRPGELVVPATYSADAVTAGAAMLMFQISLPILLFSSSALPAQGSNSEQPATSTLELLGGTNAIHAPQVDYTKHIFLPFVHHHFGVPKVDLKVLKRGYFPKGGGSISATIPPLFAGQKLKCLKLLEKGKLKSIKGIAHFSKLPTVVGSEMVRGAVRALRKAGYRALDPEEVEMTGQAVGEKDIAIDIEAVREPNNVAVAAGSGIVLWAEFESGDCWIGGSAVGEKKISPEDVGKEAAEQLLKGLEGGGCVDEWLQDQIVIFMALADGISEVRCAPGELELHTRTAIWLAEQLTDAKFTVNLDPLGTVIRCEGIGYTARENTREA